VYRRALNAIGSARRWRNTEFKGAAARAATDAVDAEGGASDECVAVPAAAARFRRARRCSP